MRPSAIPAAINPRPSVIWAIINTGYVDDKGFWEQELPNYSLEKATDWLMIDDKTGLLIGRRRKTVPANT